MQFHFSRHALALAAAVCCSVSWAQSAPAPAGASSAPVRSLGLITVTGTAPSSLPTEVPATLHGITAEQLATQINATDSGDALKYLPSLNVRKRYVGDYDHAVIASRASGTSNSARALVFADGISLSNLLGNGASYTPRWGMVEPQEIERVDVMYGPFSAAYGGNSVGAVVDFVTRMPRAFETSASVGASSQKFAQYGSERRYGSSQVSASLGHRLGPWAFRLGLSHQDSNGQPLVWTNRLQSAGAAPGTGAVAVSGAITELNPRSQAWEILGETSLVRTAQTQAKARLSYDLAPQIRATYTLGAWQNNASRDAYTYLRDAAGQAVASGAVLVNGLRYTLTGNDFALRQENLSHSMHGFTLAQRGDALFNWRVTASTFAYDRDEMRASSGNAVAHSSGKILRTAGPGTLTRMDGTGWRNVGASASWALHAQHTLEFGVQQEAYKLNQQREVLGDWLVSASGTLNGLSQGRTQVRAVYAQDNWRITPDWRLIGGLRHESWRASDGIAQGAGAPTSLASRSESAVSPKFALAHQLSDAWKIKLAHGNATRWPTVAELYQSTGSLGNTINNDPNLRPERSRTTELSGETDLGRSGKANLRLTAFAEATRDALYSQTDVNTNVTNVQNVDRIRTKGFEAAFESKAFLHPQVDLNASLTYADSVIQANAKNPASIGKKQPRVPDWRANAVLSYRQTSALTHTLGLRHSGRQYSQLDNSDTNENAYQSVSEFTMLDWRTQWHINANWTLAGGIANLNNRSYWAFHRYPARTLHAQLKWAL